MAECEALRSIRHRNLLKVITSCSSIGSQGEEIKVIVYDFIPRGNLDEWLHPESYEHEQLKELSLVKRLNTATNVASALDYLHCQGQIIHCDLKPNNVPLDDGSCRCLPGVDSYKSEIALKVDEFELQNTTNVLAHVKAKVKIDYCDVRIKLIYQ
ncbi:hypothetical protein ZIOFF_044791 [Zingiber officinale]|uniref:Protein kinase domain-containing protein n=1 Tax=Zingiber officinale TaxID=94328 RepID=A0A8J5L0G4_ZINOF|nr:hypothetical protein ZIOFF_044791 [Zingiber officinale]